MDNSTIKRGAQLFAYDRRGRELKPQQIEVGAALDELRSTTAVTMSRRTSKTESVLLWIFAMMEQVPGLRVAFTMATTREAARQKYIADVLPVMEEFAELRGDVHLLRGAGYEHIRFNASVFTVVAPSDKAFRSKEFDIIVIDEAGAAPPEFKDEVLPAALPTLDTSSIGMLVLMGTAGEYRAGNLLWDALQDADAAIVDHSGGDDIDVERLSDWEYAAAMLEAHHVGLRSGLTTLDRLKRNWALLTPERFAREYLGVWGNAGGEGGIFSADQWAALYTLEAMPDTPPKRFALGVAATEDAGAIVAAWRDSDGAARILLIDSREARAWLPGAARDLARRYRVPVVLDARASQVMADVKQRLEQLRPAPRVAVQDYEDVGAAHERIVQEIDNGNVRHYGQQQLTDAFLRVKRVQMGAKWKFGPMSDGDDITPARAATLALRYFDAQPRAVRGTIEAVAV